MRPGRAGAEEGVAVALHFSIFPDPVESLQLPQRRLAGLLLEGGELRRQPIEGDKPSAR